jgi:hypothetical protein
MPDSESDTADDPTVRDNEPIDVVWINIVLLGPIDNVAPLVL